MTPVRVDEALWSSVTAPEGILLAWMEPNGVVVGQGARLAEVLIEGASHEILAPAGGLLVHDMVAPGIVDPGATIGRILEQIPLPGGGKVSRRSLDG